MAKSNWFRVFVEGDTTDGRKIERQWIKDIAETYNQKTYSARVWLEHLRSTLADGAFRAFGDVLAVKAEEVDIPNIGKKLALFAQIDPTSDLVAMNKARQKLFTSAEVQPNFANTGKAYLVGLAVTDTPASLGTEMLAFAAGAENNPLAGRKLDKDNVFTAATEFELQIEEEKPETENFGAKLVESVKNLLGKNKQDTNENFTAIGQAVQAVAESQAEVLTQFGTLTKTLETATKSLQDLTQQVEKDRAAFSALEKRLGETEQPGTPRAPATGGDGGVKTDC